MKKEWRPVLVLGAVAAYYFWRNSQENPILGTRTVAAIKEFQDTLGPIAKTVEAETGISAKLGLIQAALESNYGLSGLSRPDAKLTILPSNATGPALNLFGFKTGSAWLNGGNPYVNIITTDYYQKGEKMPNGELAPTNNFALKWPAPFRAYGSWEESYRDWARLMQTPMYVKDGALDALKRGDVIAFGKALSIHYAPNQNYDARLSGRASDMGLA